MTRTLDGLRVLLIDDQPAARGLVRAMLKELKIDQVFEATDGREGLQFLDNAADLVDIVVCDWNMPNMSGIELLRQLRSVDPDMPFLMVTGRANQDSVVAAKSAGVTAYIAKPFSQLQLEAKLRAILPRLKTAG